MVFFGRPNRNTSLQNKLATALNADVSIKIFQNFHHSYFYEQQGLFLLTTTAIFGNNNGSGFVSFDTTFPIAQTWTDKIAK